MKVKILKGFGETGKAETEEHIQNHPKGTIAVINSNLNSGFILTDNPDYYDVGTFHFNELVTDNSHECDYIYKITEITGLDGRVRFSFTKQQ